MTKQKIHPLYIIFLVTMIVLALLGLVLLIGGMLRKPALPNPWLLLRPIALCGRHG